MHLVARLEHHGLPIRPTEGQEDVLEHLVGAVRHGDPLGRHLVDLSEASTQ